jgi:hypothetical protein
LPLVQLVKFFKLIGWDGIFNSGASAFRMDLTRESYKSYGWEQMDRAFGYAAERGIQIYPYLYDESRQFPTSWGSVKTEGTWDYWVDSVVRRYGYSGTFWSSNPTLPYRPVTTWEVWNEPNLAQNNPGGTNVYPEKYAEFLKHTAEVIRAAQSPSSTQVLFAGLFSPAQTKESGGKYTSLSVPDFLQKAHVLEVGGAFDGLSLHPYTFAATEAEDLANFKTRVEEAREGLDKYNTSKTLWITELGWPVAGEGGTPTVTTTEQKNLLTSSFNWIKSHATEKKIQLVNWYTYRDGACGGWQCHAGLREAGSGAAGAFRSAWAAFQSQTGAAKWEFVDSNPNSWHSENLGGNTTSSPDLSTKGPGRLQVFGRGSDGALWSRTMGFEAWSGWTSLGGSLRENGGPGAVSINSSSTDVVAVNSEATTWHWWESSGSWSGPESLGGNSTSDPDLASWGPEREDVFARGSDGHIWHRAWAGGWGSWEKLNEESIEGGPAAVSWGSGRIDVVARSTATNHPLLHWWYDGSWHGPENLGGINTSDPDIASEGPGHLQVVVRGSDQKIYLRQYDTVGGWYEWENFSSEKILYGPTVTSWRTPDYRLDVAAVKEDHTLLHWWFGPGGP